jgi:uncharacterized protein YegP (UPF0339 family)
MNTSRWEIFRNNMHWEFQLRAGNGKILIQSTNHYHSVERARDALKVIQNLTRQTLPIVSIKHVIFSE